MGQLGRGDSCDEQCRSPGQRVSSRRGCWYRILRILAHQSINLSRKATGILWCCADIGWKGRRRTYPRLRAFGDIN